MRICYLADATSTHTQRWVGFFASQGHEVHLVSALPSSHVGAGVIYHQLPATNNELLLTRRLPRIRGFENLWRTRRQIRALIGSIQPDLVHAHFISTYGKLAYLAGRKPYIVTAWGTDIYGFHNLRCVDRILTRQCLRRADLVTCDSQDLKRAIVALGVQGARVQVVHHGVDTELFRPLVHRHELRATLGIADHEWVLLSPRSLKPLYNIEIIVKAFFRVCAAVPDSRLVIKDYYGDPAYRESVFALVRGLGLERRVTFAGYGPYEDMARWYNVADIVVSLATTDSAPMSVLEAMACGAIVVASDLASLRDYVANGEDGFLVDPRDEKVVAEKIIEALLKWHGVDASRSTRNRRVVIQKADYGTHMRRMQCLCANLLGAN